MEFKPSSLKELSDAVDLWCNNRRFAIKKYGHISVWNTSMITNMAYLFSGKKEFNDNIGDWDTSKVTDMQGMFCNAESFNQDIGRWNVSNVINMNNMFWNAKHFNQDISNWNTSSVRDMTEMFCKAGEFNQNLSNWKVCLATRHMFSCANSMRYENEPKNIMVNNYSYYP